MVGRCIETFGRIDILHNNVVIVEPGGPVEASEESWDRVMKVNLKSMFLTCKCVLPYMEKQRYGSIVNISSIAAIIVPYPAVSYTASKAGIIARIYEYPNGGSVKNTDLWWGCCGDDETAGCYVSHRKAG